VPNRSPEEIRAEAELCRKRAAGCSDAEMAQDWLSLAAEFDKIAVVAESRTVGANPEHGWNDKAGN